jgi:hypothetical protein
MHRGEGRLGERARIGGTAQGRGFLATPTWRRRRSPSRCVLSACVGSSVRHRLHPQVHLHEPQSPTSLATSGPLVEKPFCSFALVVHTPDPKTSIQSFAKGSRTTSRGVARIGGANRGSPGLRSSLPRRSARRSLRRAHALRAWAAACAQPPLGRRAAGVASRRALRAPKKRTPRTGRARRRSRPGSLGRPATVREHALARRLSRRG